MQSVRFVLRTVCPRLTNPYDLSTPNQGSPYNLSPYGLSKANQSKKAVCTICLPYDLSADQSFDLKLFARSFFSSMRNFFFAKYNTQLFFFSLTKNTLQHLLAICLFCGRGISFEQDVKKPKKINAQMYPACGSNCTATFGPKKVKYCIISDISEYQLCLKW